MTSTRDLTTNARVYGAYGRRASDPGARAAYTGQPVDRGTGGYLLGSRPYAPHLRRFLAPDPESPFDDGGLNRYAYCGGDPVSRVDPSGNAWWSWIGDALGYLGAALGTVAWRAPPSAGADVSRGLAAAMDTSDTLAIRRAATTDVTPAASRSSARVPSTSRGVGSSRPDASSSRVVLYKGRDNVPPSRLRIVRNKETTTVDWMPHPHPSKPKATHWLSDTDVTVEDVEAVMPQIERETRQAAESTDVYVYSGVHGASSGQNWHRGKRRRIAPSFFRDDAGRTLVYEISANNPVTVENIGLIRKPDMRRRMRRSGHHVHAYCFSLADSVVMKELAIGVARVYEL